MSARAKLSALILGITALGAAGCKEFHYYDIHVRFDGTAGFNSNNVSTVQTCHVFVTGADTTDFYLTENCSAASPPRGTVIGTFEFATFADSGELTFTIKTYNGFTETDNCLFGVGTKSYPVSGVTTRMDDPGPDDDLVINMMTPGCPPI
jgi:hypothetical protein